MEEKWETTHGTADQKNRDDSPGCHLQQVCTLINFVHKLRTKFIYGEYF